MLHVRNTGKESDIKFPGTIMRLTKQNWFVEEWSASADGQSEYDYLQYKRAKLEVNKTLRKAKATYYQLKVSSARSQSDFIAV